MSKARRKKSRREQVARAEPSSPARAMLAVLPVAERSDTQGFEHAWAGLEPTLSTPKAVEKWIALSAKGHEDAYFSDSYMLRTQRKVASAIEKRYRAARKKGDEACLFADVEHGRDEDQWGVERQTLAFHWEDSDAQPFEVRFGLDPETFEFSIKPVPVAWFYEPRFVRFMQVYLWGVPQALGLAPSIAHGGGQFSFSAKTFLQGSLLADDIATRLDHPELASWIMDFPNPDDRAFRATNARRAAFERVLESYWAGGFHPRSIGTLTVENALLDRGFRASQTPGRGLVDPRAGPVGTPNEVFLNNFAFGRALRLEAQSVHPGYWQSAHPDEDGYRPDQIMRYSEGNLNRLQIAGELHVKSGKVLDPKDVPEFDAPLEPAMLYDEASWEMRAQMSRASAEDFVEALLLDVHHARWLQANPHVRMRTSLLQDQIMGDAERTLEHRAPKVLTKLRKHARRDNLESSKGRVKSDWIEPEPLFWAAWKELPAGEQAAIAVEAIAGFVERVERAASVDPRAGPALDPMEAHRHRIHPLLWKALQREPGAAASAPEVERERRLHASRKAELVARRPPWSITGAKPPWKR